MTALSPTASWTALIDRAQALKPLVRACAPEAEEARTLPRRAVDALGEAGLFRVTAAAAYGGFETDPVTTIKALEAVSEADGSAGWVSMIAAESLGLGSGSMEPAFARELFANPRLSMAGALNPIGRALRVKGGWRVTGRWPFASGCPHADAYMAGCLLYDEDEAPITVNGVRVSREMFVPVGQFEIIDTWSVGGLRGTGSHDVAVTDVFVPQEHTTSIIFEPPREQGTLFRLPLFSRLAYSKVAVATGVARAAIEAFIALANEKRPMGSRELLRDRPSAQQALAEAEWLLEAGRAYCFETCMDVWERVDRGDEATLEQRARLRIGCSQAVLAAVKAVDLVYAAGGSSVNYTRSPLERCFRDVHVVPQHAMVTPHVLGPAGRVLMGMDPDWLTF